MTKFAVLVEYELPDDDGVRTFDVGELISDVAHRTVDAVRELMPVNPANVTAFTQHAAEQITAFARTV